MYNLLYKYIKKCLHKHFIIIPWHLTEKETNWMEKKSHKQFFYKVFMCKIMNAVCEVCL